MKTKARLVRRRERPRSRPATNPDPNRDPARNQSPARVRRPSRDHVPVRVHVPRLIRRLDRDRDRDRDRGRVARSQGTRPDRDPSPPRGRVRLLPPSRRRDFDRAPNPDRNLARDRDPPVAAVAAVVAEVAKAAPRASEERDQLSMVRGESWFLFFVLYSQFHFIVISCYIVSITLSHLLSSRFWLSRNVTIRCEPNVF